MNPISNHTARAPSPSMSEANQANRLSGSSRGFQACVDGAKQFTRRFRACFLGIPAKLPSTTISRVEMTEHLDQWINNPSCSSIEKSNRQEAKNRILAVFDAAKDDPCCQNLDLRFLNLTSLPDCIRHLRSLQKLDLSFNRLTVIPDGVGNLTNLRELFLSKNQLTSLPYGIKCLTNLRTLNLNENNLVNLPDTVRNLTSLEAIFLNQNHLSSLPSYIGHFKNLTCLSLNSNQLTSLPDAVGNLTNLQYLNLSYNRLISLPNTIGNLTNLQRFTLNSNQLSSLPDAVSNLTNLQDLNLSDNQLSSLPDAFGNLTKLQNLHLISNRLTNLPVVIKNISSLSKLHLNYNRLTSLPEAICDLPRLSSLQLYANPLTSLPENIVNLPAFCQITISANHLSPAVFSRLQSILNSQDYSGPRIDYQMEQLQVERNRSLPEAVAKWIQELELSATGLHDWSKIDFSSFSREPHAADFAEFLERLREPTDYLNPDTKEDFQRRVGQLLLNIQHETELRASCFNLAQDAINTCGDRVALRMLNMESLCLDQQMETSINTGKFDEELQTVVDYCKAQYRLQVLDDAAKAKTNTLHFVDEIEVKLGFIVAFSQDFDLPVKMNTMLYPRFSNIEPQDIAETRKKLTNDLPADNLADEEKSRNNEALKHFLVNSPAIQAWLAKQYPNEATSMQTQIKTKIDEEKTKLTDAMTALDSTDSGYVQACQALQKAYEDLPTSVNLQHKGDWLTAIFCKLGVNQSL